MPTTVSVSLITRIRQILHALSPSERRLAETVLDFPGGIAGYSASELAHLANVSNATVTRFVRRLGYEGFDDARRSARAEHGAGSPLFLSGSVPNAPVGSLAAHVEQSIANVAGTFRRLTEPDIEEIATRMVQARKVWIVGYRSSQGLASYLRWQIVQVVAGATLIPGPGETLAEHLAGMGADDVAIVYALRRRVAVLPDLLRQMLALGVKVAVITNTQAVEALPATWTLRCDSQAPGPLDNHVSVMAVSHLLATRVMEQAGADGRRRLATIQTLHDALAEL
ncbi:MAG TPA: MurR/RpiR family transcriptional regulator [Xanthobacteraceae bacterium]|nr:MurR/RpiR family transcriptional regulator [Xanthobacteraceae bacterium]